jgi:hypothetical protein
MFLQVIPKPEWWDRFFASVYRFDRSDKGNGCWIWTGPWDECGYGFFAINGKSETGRRIATNRAHRFLLEQYIGKIPRGLVVLHSCDTPQCVNPYHLSVGTIRDNVTDRDAKYRRIIKLNIDQAREILELRGNGISAIEVSKAYDVSPTLIRNIWRGHMWQRAHKTAASAADGAQQAN